MIDNGWQRWWAWYPVWDRIGNAYWLTWMWCKTVNGRMIYEPDWEEI